MIATESSGNRIAVVAHPPSAFRHPESKEVFRMCRNIKTLANFEPPATNDEVRASALQFVRKLSGTTKPSKANEEIFNQAVDDVTEVARRLVDSLVIHAPPRDREVEAQRAKERALKRFG
jgi:hypothetical protein